MQRKLRMGMIGGGKDAFIGAIHRAAAQMDGLIELVCGAFSSTPQKSKEAGAALHLDAKHVYNNFEEMIEAELALPPDARMDFVSIVTPNHMHYAPAKLALEHGFHVVMDKPITLTLAEAKSLKTIALKNNKIICLTHTYTGYPMVKEAKHFLKTGKLGTIRKIEINYPQGWLTNFLESENQKQASWRTDPNKSGIAGSMGDIGTHAFNLAEYVTSLETVEIGADINIVVPGRKLDDDGLVWLKFNNGSKGILKATQIAAGEENNLHFSVYGDKGGLSWEHANPNTLLIKWLDKPAEVYRAGTGYLSAAATAACRTPAGHPEGFIEAFANIYRNFAHTLDASLNNTTADEVYADFPTADDGIRGMAFIENVIKAGNENIKWQPFVV